MMTQEEHRLMMTMFTRQHQLLVTTLKIMENAGVALPDDLRAYHEAVRHDDALTTEIVELISREYRKIASRNGVVVDALE